MKQKPQNVYKINEFDLETRKCCQCTSTFKVLKKSKIVTCSIYCLELKLKKRIRGPLDGN